MTSDYDEFAAEYDAENESNLLNAHYERPAMLALAGDVAGRRILDAGCGSGPLTAALRERGAVVSGFDGGQAMIDIARRRVGAGVDLRVADLGEPLPYADGSFDDVVASLVLHYLHDWTGALAELRRVLRPGGRLLISVNHPLVHPLSGGRYLGVAEFPIDITIGGRDVSLRTIHRPLHAMIDAFKAAGFLIDDIAEPPIADETPEDLVPNGTRRFVSFIFFVLRSPAR